MPGMVVRGCQGWSRGDARDGDEETLEMVTRGCQGWSRGDARDGDEGMPGMMTKGCCSMGWGTAAQQHHAPCPAPQHGSSSSLRSPAQKPVPLWPTNGACNFLASRAAKSQRATPRQSEQHLDLSCLLRLQACSFACRQAPMAALPLPARL